MRELNPEKWDLSAGEGPSSLKRNPFRLEQDMEAMEISGAEGGGTDTWLVVQKKDLRFNQGIPETLARGS